MADSHSSASHAPDDRPVDDQLADLRVRIDGVDQQLLALLNEREIGRASCRERG